MILANDANPRGELHIVQRLKVLCPTESRHRFPR